MKQTFSELRSLAREVAHAGVRYAVGTCNLLQQGRLRQALDDGFFARQRSILFAQGWLESKQSPLHSELLIALARSGNAIHHSEVPDRDYCWARRQLIIEALTHQARRVNADVGIGYSFGAVAVEHLVLRGIIPWGIAIGPPNQRTILRRLQELGRWAVGFETLDERWGLSELRRLAGKQPSWPNLLIIRGEHDGTVPPETTELPNVRCVEISASHATLTRHNETREIILDFLEKNVPTGNVRKAKQQVAV